MAEPMRGMLVEYALAIPPLVLWFEFNPSTLTRTRKLTITGETDGEHSLAFTTPGEASRAARKFTADAETLDLVILLDATDRMSEGDPLAAQLGVQPQIDTLRCMMEPKVQGAAGFQTLASLGAGTERAIATDRSLSVLLFVWGTHILPVFMTSLSIAEKAYLPTLVPYRAEATLGLQVIESENPFYRVETARKIVGAAINVSQTLAHAVGTLI